MSSASSDEGSPLATRVRPSLPPEGIGLPNKLGCVPRRLVSHRLAGTARHNPSPPPATQHDTPPPTCAASTR
ncbi:Hypp8930 [Branchiostoma lanceolatum]|uniref:Hypp8930 protein n=1 Tax=Branchiostoma lanceolatum TaxID=7740 RepID=A0A8J9ZBX7_BRALA|nr:Hypp8930 [Branchiostoma lanceolatum]